MLGLGRPRSEPLASARSSARKLSLLDGARLFALTAAARADALIAVFDAKYHYDFWRPVTAIRNGDIDDNAATERDAAWQPIDAIPMHPEYPCAHCIATASLASVAEPHRVCRQLQLRPRFYTSSAPLDIDLLARAARGHWGVDGMHWLLEVEFKDDLSACRAGHGAAINGTSGLLRASLGGPENDLQSTLRVRR